MTIKSEENEKNDAEGTKANLPAPTKAEEEQKPGQLQHKKTHMPVTISDIIRRTENFLTERYEFRRNIVSGEVEFRFKYSADFVPANADTIFRQLQYAGIRFGYPQIKSLLQSDFVKDFDPFKEYFENLPAWDGVTDHIRKFAWYVQTDDFEFFYTMLVKMLVRVIACALDHVPNRIVMVLYGKQEMGKSWWVRFLSPWGIKKYYTEAPMRDDKDTNMRFSENLIYNLEELADLTNFEVGRLKSIISSASTKERKPYAINEVVMPRRCSFFGSTNKVEFLTDTESTRWWIVNALHIDHNYKDEIKIADVWAQAYALYKSGFDGQLTDAEKEKRNKVNKDYEVTYTESDAVSSYLIPCEKSAKGAVFMSRQQIIDHLHDELAIKLVGTDRHIINPIRLQPHLVTKALSALGFKSGRKYLGKNQVRGYYLILNHDKDYKDAPPTQPLFEDED